MGELPFGWTHSGCWIELVTHAEVERAAHHGDVLNLWVRVWRDFVSVQHPNPHGEEALLGRIALAASLWR
jgi:hypothetical protein